MIYLEGLFKKRHGDALALFEHFIIFVVTN